MACSACGGKGGKGGSPTGGSPFAKYSGGGDSSRGYERGGTPRAFKASLYPSDISLSPFDRYAMAQRHNPALPGSYRQASTIDRYTPPKPASDSFLGMGRYRAAERQYRLPMQRPPALWTELEERENRKKKFQAQ